MKNRTMTLAIILCVLAIGIVLVLVPLFHSNENDAKVGEIANLRETEVGDLPDFGIIIRGAYEGMIVNSDIPKMKAYEFDATVNNGWSIETNHYVGIRVRDAFEYLSIKEYDEVEFFSKGRVTIVYRASEINDDTYFIIKRDGKLINDFALNMISFDKDYHYSLENVVRIGITQEAK